MTRQLLKSQQEISFTSPDGLTELELEFGGLGCHLLADFYQCSTLPSEAEQLEKVMVAAALASNATIVESTFHRFSPIGLSGVVVIAESHLACHTWPEHETACIDFFSCSQTIDMAAAIESLWHSIGAKKVTISNVGRGIKES